MIQYRSNTLTTKAASLSIGMARPPFLRQARGNSMAFHVVETQSSQYPWSKARQGQSSRIHSHTRDPQLQIRPRNWTRQQNRPAIYKDGSHRQGLAQEIGHIQKRQQQGHSLAQKLSASLETATQGLPQSIDSGYYLRY